MPDEVKRYLGDLRLLVGSNEDDGIRQPLIDAEMVLASDYDALAASLAETETVLARLQDRWDNRPTQPKLEQRVLDAEAERDKLAAELAEVRATVSEWACETCRYVYPGPPQAGFKCVVCPRCGGSTMPHELLRTREAEAERDALRAALERIAGEPAEYYANIARSALRTERGAGHE